MNKKIVLTRFCKVVSLLLAVALVLSFLQEYVLCRADNNRERIKGFYLEEEDTLDMVIIGASEVYTGYAAAYAYSSYGFTSYPIATQSNTVLNYLACVKEAVRTQHPQLLVIEINGMLYDNSQLDNEVNMRRIADNMPNNASKRELTAQFDDYDLTDAYLPIMKYHSVWEDFPIGLEWSGSQLLSRVRGHNLLKGVTTTTKTYQGSDKLYNTDPKLTKAPLVERCEQALIELLEYCKQEELNVVFVRFPHLVNLKGVRRLRRSMTAADIIRSYGFEYYGLDDKFDEIGLEPHRDFYDTEHVNVYGQKKLTDYLSKMIAGRLGPYRCTLDAQIKKEWDTSADYYEAFYDFAVELINSGEVIRVAEDVVTMERMEAYLK